ncbi:MAG: alkaline phosphatase D family protein [Alphaproteobacteria bacterium]
MKRRSGAPWFPITLLFLAVACAAAGPTETPLTRVAFGSCLDQKLPQPIFRTVRAYDPDIFLFLGDNVYGDVSSGDMTELTQAYAALDRNQDFRALRQETPLLATWDDHDYGANDAGAGFRWREAAEKLFLDFWQVPEDDERRGRKGVYTSRMQGPPGRRVQIILLDTRYFRADFQRTGQRRPKYAPDNDPGKTMLGEAQWAWLEAELRKPADLRLLVSSIQVLADGHGWERWGHLPRERTRLFDVIRRTDAQGVILLSGDRHFGALYENPDAVGYPLYELTSSSLNRPWRRAKEADSRQIGAVIGMENFGAIDIDWSARSVVLSLRRLDGSTARRQVVRLPAAGS